MLSIHKERSKLKFIIVTLIKRIICVCLTYLSDFFILSSNLVVLVFDFVLQFNHKLFLNVTDGHLGELFKCFPLGLLEELLELIVKDGGAE